MWWGRTAVGTGGFLAHFICRSGLFWFGWDKMGLC